MKRTKITEEQIRFTLNWGGAAPPQLVGRISPSRAKGSNRHSVFRLPLRALRRKTLAVGGWRRPRRLAAREARTPCRNDGSGE